MVHLAGTRVRHMFALIAAFGLVIGARESTLSAPVPSAASNCPVLLAIQPPQGGRYVALVGARTAMTTAVTMTLYTSAGSVTFTKDSVRIDTALPQPYTSYRSSPIAIAKSSDGPYLAARVRFAPANASVACSPVDRIISQDTSADGPLLPDVLGYSQTIAAEAGAQQAVTPQRAPDSKPLTCSEPFVDAAVVPPVAVPPYPTAARLARATGRVMVKVTLDTAGNVANAAVLKSSGNADLDSAAMSAARATKYRAPTFLCRPEGGAYIFEADFTGR